MVSRVPPDRPMPVWVLMMVAWSAGVTIAAAGVIVGLGLWRWEVDLHRKDAFDELPGWRREAALDGLFE
jgi:hypothetical protein